MAKQCPVCDVNLWWWNKLAREFSPRVRIIAVAMSNFPPQEMYKMVVHKQLPYKVFYPVDREKFSQSFRLTFEESRTLLIRGGKIYSSAPGEFGAVDYFKIKKLIKGAENEKNKKNAYRPDRSYTDHGVGGCNP